jgi:cell shape-determining protein MreC
MQPNKAGIFLILVILGLILIMLTSITAQKAIKPHPIKGWHNMNMDSMIAVTVKKNSAFIEKRVGELKHAEKACDSFKTVVTELKQENTKLNEKINSGDDDAPAQPFELKPIVSEDKNN